MWFENLCYWQNIYTDFQLYNYNFRCLDLYFMIQFSKHSGIVTLLIKQKIPVPINKAWKFFSAPQNLSDITPSHMGFQITSRINNYEMYPGQIISYRVFPFPGIGTNWVTEISHVKDEEYFVDEQRFGPYAMWHHEHHFLSIPGGTEIIDQVSYKLPLGFIGQLLERLIVRRKLKEIFDFRQKKLMEFFGIVSS